MKTYNIVADMPEDVPSGWTVFNAPRPIVGHKEWRGDFLHGTFYAAVDPTGQRADWMIEENRKLDAWALCYWKHTDAIGVIKNNYNAKYKSMANQIEAMSDDQLLVGFDNLMNRGD